MPAVNQYSNKHENEEVMLVINQTECVVGIYNSSVNLCHVDNPAHL